MKTIKRILLVWSIIAIGVSCTKDFATINTNPSVVTVPDVRYLFTYSEENVFTYNPNSSRSSEWTFEYMEQMMRYTQYVSTDAYEFFSGGVNTRYGNFYLNVLPNLFEIRRQISLYKNKENYQYMGATTYILQVLFGIKVTDMNGAMPYSTAIQGRYEEVQNPAYDSQESLFTKWLAELDNAIAVLSNTNVPLQQTYGNNDILYLSDWNKWIKLANTLKLRIAVRIENQNKEKAKLIFQQVMKNSVGPVSSNNEQVSYSSISFKGLYGGERYRAIRFAGKEFMDFLKRTNDPRLKMYFFPNDLTGDYKSNLEKNKVTLPGFINPDDPLIEYQGAPADRTIESPITPYTKTPLAAGQKTYYLISEINFLFFSPNWNQGTGIFTDIPVTYAETCFTIAEFIQKGYGAGVNTKGTAEEWYKKGITSSIQTMNSIAKTALSTQGYTGDGTTEINAYLNQPDVKFNGVNDLERIYMQQYLNFFRNGNESFVLCRRTGFPKKNSTYYKREQYNPNVPIPRRWWLSDPGEVNRANWTDAMNNQGFTKNSFNLKDLNSERIWYDKTAPDFGEGNF